MKKLSVIAVVVAACMLFAIPAMAVDVNFSGAYRARGFYNDNPDLDDDTGASQAFVDQRLRVKMEFQVTDTLSVIGRFDANEKRWGDSDTATAAANIDWDHAYMKAKFDMFDLYVGRMPGGVFGTKFGDHPGYFEHDAVKLVKDIEPLKLFVQWQKRAEQDDVWTVPQTSDQDQDVYLLGGIYKAEGLEAGFLAGYYRYRNNSDTSNTDTFGATSTDVNASVNYEQNFYTWSPYLKMNVGPVALQGEAIWFTGTYKDFSSGTTQDLDFDALTYNLEGSTDLGPAKVGLGYAFSSGDYNGTDKEYSAAFPCFSWEPLLILTGWTSALQGGNFNGINVSGPAVSAIGLDNPGTTLNYANLGYKIWYVTGSFSPMEDVTLSAIVGDATADETPVGWDDDVGREYDVAAKVKLMDNLNYTITFAWLDAGDLYKFGVAGATVDDTYSMFHKLEVKF